MQPTEECKNLSIVNGKIETSKKDKDSHGIGLRSVRQATESIGGTLEIKPRKDMFTVTVRIPISKKNSDYYSLAITVFLSFDGAESI